MPTITEQIKLEKKMVAFGAARYVNGLQRAEEDGRGADTQYAQKLLREFVMPVSTRIQEMLDAGKTIPGRAKKFRGLLRRVETDTSAFLGLRAMFQHFTTEQGVASLALQIGTMIEDEGKFRMFHQAHPDYYEAIIKDFERKGTKDYRHMHRVLTMKANEYNIRWPSWSTEEKIEVGGAVISAIVDATPLVEKKLVRQGRQHRVLLVPTQEALDWVREHTQHNSLLNPDRMPCIIPPDPWTSLDSGGYWTPQMRSKTKLVKTRSKGHAKMFDGDISNITTAVNIVQRVPWAVNTDVLEVLTDFWKQSIPVGLPQSAPYIIPGAPFDKKVRKADMSEDQLKVFNEWKNEARTLYTMEKERVSKCFAVVRALRLADEFREYEKFWFVYQCDFRGRLYCTVSGLSPQGADFSKALLRFADGKELGERGAYWFKVHGANCYGKDKLSYADRAAWVAANTRDILRTAEDPHRMRDFWAQADKPWQFLAWAFEFKRFHEEGTKMVSYLPIGLDGSCNGLQNFSAMLRDEVGGRATNLVPASKPSDIYSEVCKVCTDMLRERDDDKARMWVLLADSLGGTLARALAKKPVMTLPYGSTQQACRESIYQYLVEDAPHFFPKERRWELSSYLTPILWQAIGRVVIAAREAMAWIQGCASVLGKKNKPITWWTPLGFPVLQDRKKQVVKRIRTEICGGVQLSVQFDGAGIDTHKQMLGASPNFVHSMDACHLMMTLHRAFASGVMSFAVIHDDYGTHAADTDALHKAIREAFVELYGENDPLLDFKASNETEHTVQLKAPPKHGNLNLNQVLDSEYFFG